MAKSTHDRVTEWLENWNRRYIGSVEPHNLWKATALVVLIPWMLLLILWFHGKVEMLYAVYAATFCFIIAIIFVLPYMANLNALTSYVRNLARNQKAEQPDLTFLSNVGELSDAVDELQHSWEDRSKQLEAMVAESKILVDTLPDVIAMLDDDFEILRTNSSARQLFGETYKEVIAAILHEPDIMQAAKLVMKQKVGKDISYYLASHDRHYVIRIERFPSYSFGDISLVIAMHDITAQKHTERTLSDFVANASHEIRTPLTSVMGFIETLKTSTKDDPETTGEFLDIMMGQTERMSKLVGDLLSLSQIERSIETSPTETVNLAPILQIVCSHLAEEAEARGVTIVLETDDLPDITGDAGQLEQVFQNLVSNAIKYGKKDATITISSKEKGGMLSVSVKDEGKGIAKEHLERLTERFYRVDPARSRKVGGNGLGLSIVKHILERHNGSLDIDSTVGKGSVFTVNLPLIGVQDEGES